MIRGLGPRLALLVLLSQGLPGDLHGAVAVDGLDMASVRTPAGVPIEDYENSGYSLRLERGRAEVEVRPSPLQSRIPFIAPKNGADRGLFSLATSVASGATSRFEAVSRILGWISRGIRYDLDRSLPQDPTSVLERRSAYCTGVARLTVALLQELDIPAREVPGLVAGHGGGYHRWVEVLYEDRGWVFSDPLRTHHYVPATYLRLASEEVPGSLSGLMLERENGIQPVDLMPWGAPQVLARKNLPGQRAAAVQVRVIHGGAEVAVLQGHGAERKRRLEQGRATFLGVDPGRYTVAVYRDGRLVQDRWVRLEQRARRAIVFDLASGETQ